MASNTPTIVIVGAGVLGLTCALELQAAHRHLDFLLVAREWPTSIPGAPVSHSADYASMWAGAHVRPIPASTPQLQREARWLKHTAARFGRLLEEDPAIGITKVLGVEYLEAPDAAYQRQDARTFAAETGLAGYKEYSADQLPDGVRLGFQYETYCINSPLYCGNLLRKFILQGGKALGRDLKSEGEAFSLAPNVKLVVNATGMGFGDSKCFPIRGQTVLTSISSGAQTVTRQNKDGTWNFIIPRFFSGGTVIGGTKELGNWDLEPSQETRNRLLAAVPLLTPQLNPTDADHSPPDPESIHIIKDIVGRRPARDGGMRVEVETRNGAHSGDLKHVIHAYGAGGRGFEVSWGVANEVAGLANQIQVLDNGIKSKM